MEESEYSFGDIVLFGLFGPEWIRERKKERAIKNDKKSTSSKPVLLE